MHPRATSLIARFSAWRRLEVLSADLAIGTASIFVAAVAIASLAADRGGAGLGIAGGSWSLRGTLGPTDLPGPVNRHQLLFLNKALTRLS